MQASILDWEESEKNKRTILREEKVKKEEKRKKELLREITLKIGLERIDKQEEITVETLLDSRATGLVMSLEFARKQRFKEDWEAHICKKYRWLF